MSHCIFEISQKHVQQVVTWKMRFMKTCFQNVLDEVCDCACLYRLGQLTEAVVHAVVIIMLGHFICKYAAF